MKTIQVTQSFLPNLEEYVEEIQELWDSRWLTNMGKKHRQFESQLKTYLRTPNLSLFSNGHLALETAIAGFGLSGEVITTPFTFASTTHAIVRNGLTPVFCDIREDDYTIDTTKIEKLITNKTTAIIPIHVYGNVCDVENIKDISIKNKLKVIYDAAHAFGIHLNGESVANFGDASMFSFHATKVFHSIEGGAITFKDPTNTEVYNALKNFGIADSGSVDYIGGNAKLNEFQAAMGIVNLRYIDREIQKRKIVFERYLEHLSNIPGIKVNNPISNVTSNYSYFPVVFDGYHSTRDQIYEKLKNAHIYTKKYFYPLTNNFNCYQNKFSSENTPVANYIASHILTLPLYSSLSLEDVDRICSIIKAQ